MKICVFRLSAMGDVAMLSHALNNLLLHNPNVQFTLVTRPQFMPLFGNHERLTFHSVDLKDRHKGAMGLHRLYRELKQQRFDYFVDLHDVLRSKIVRSFFALSKTKVLVFDKDRSSKEAIVAKKAPLQELKHTVLRYLETFSSIGLNYDASYAFALDFSDQNNSIQKTENELWIGIAPFAAHESKEWGIASTKHLISLLQNYPNTKIFGFGGGPRELELLVNLENQFSNFESLIGKLTLEKELSMMGKLDFLIAMDSGNMHLGSLVGIPVVSIWLSTHPDLGFSAWGQKELCIQPSAEELPCRPCSVYGKITNSEQKTCVDKAREISTPERILEKLEEKKLLRKN